MENQTQTQNYLHDGTEILKLEKKGRGMYTSYIVHLRSEKYKKWSKDGSDIRQIWFNYDLIQCLAHDKLGAKLFDHINNVSDAITEDTDLSTQVNI